MSSEVELTPPSTAFWGPDWTRGEDPNPDARRNMGIVRVSAFGRAKAKLLDAIACPDADERDRLIDALLLHLVDSALNGADDRTILTGLL